MNDVTEDMFEEFMKTVRDKDYSGDQLPSCAKYAFLLFCHQKRQEIFGPPKREFVDFT